MTCGVFAFLLSVFLLLRPAFVLFLVLLLLCLPPFMLVVILCSGCLYLSSCIVFVVSFSLSDYMRKKKGRKGLSLASSLVPLCSFYFYKIKFIFLRLFVDC